MASADCGVWSLLIHQESPIGRRCLSSGTKSLFRIHPRFAFVLFCFWSWPVIPMSLERKRIQHGYAQVDFTRRASRISSFYTFHPRVQNTDTVLIVPGEFIQALIFGIPFRSALVSSCSVLEGSLQYSLDSAFMHNTFPSVAVIAMCGRRDIDNYLCSWLQS